LKEKKTRDFEYTRPVEQMGIAITYGGLEEIFKAMDSDELEKAVKEVEDTFADDEWDLIHNPNKDGMGGIFQLITWKN